MNPAIKRVARVGRRALAKVAGKENPVERYFMDRSSKIRGRQITEQGDTWIQHTGRTSIVVKNKDNPEPRRGIYLQGACDLSSIFVLAPMFREDVKGTVAVYRHGIGIADGRSDVLVQSMKNLPLDDLRETIELFELGDDYFRPTTFEPTFQIAGAPEFGVFPKDVVVFSLGGELVRSLYQHREKGFIVDPGGLWLNQDLNTVVKDLDKVKWFHKNFRKIGRIDLEDYLRNFETIVTAIRERAGAEVVVYNSLVVEPNDPTHNYQLIEHSTAFRRREFNMGLADLSRKLGFYVVDVDRTLKREGVSEQVDFAHYPEEKTRPVAVEALRIFKELEVI
ncbi:MAG: SGNH/GDSL hydrolase family protein [Acidimicrobiia bacterium]|nr:SGNH/GDSL hydrolase family protein [Acidimicrobiia bacterium]NNF65199.1 SGNH/GDSL hydrolase family protein [Acidimicrobiia bacterium]